MGDRSKLLLDENIGILVQDTLVEHGYDATSIITEAPGANDREVLRKAQQEHRILITLDKDFGLLVYRYTEKYAGVIFLRLSDERPRSITRTLVYVLENYAEKITDRFVTVTDDQVRIRS